MTEKKLSNSITNPHFGKTYRSSIMPRKKLNTNSGSHYGQKLVDVLAETYEDRGYLRSIIKDSLINNGADYSIFEALRNIHEVIMGLDPKCKRAMINNFPHLWNAVSDFAKTEKLDDPANYLESIN